MGQNKEAEDERPCSSDEDVVDADKDVAEDQLDSVSGEPLSGDTLCSGGGLGATAGVPDSLSPPTIVMHYAAVLERTPQAGLAARFLLAF